MLKGWKTMAVGAVFAAMGFLQQADWAEVVPPEYAGMAVGVLGLVMMALRAVTNTPVGKGD